MGRLNTFIKGLTEPIQYDRYEHLLMRAQFGFLIFQSYQVCFQESQPFPVGLAKIFDLTFLCYNYSLFQVILAVGCILYAASPLFQSPATRCRVLFVGTLIMTFVHMLMNTQRNSRGVMGHSHQVVDLTLVAQLIYLSISLRRKNYEQVDNLFVYYSQQVILATYVAAGISKEIRTHGTWIFQLKNIMVKVIKGSEVPYYSGEVDQIQYGILVQLMYKLVQTFPTLSIGMFGSALFLELFAFTFLYNRTTLFLGGLALLGMHFMIAELLHLLYISTIFGSMVSIYFVNFPYWLVQLINWVHRLSTKNSTSSTSNQSSGFVRDYISRCSMGTSYYSRMGACLLPLCSASKPHSPSTSAHVHRKRGAARVPLKVMIFVLLVCLPSFDNYYPLSSFAMYGHIGSSSGFFFVRDANDQILPLRPVQLRCSQLMKLFHNIEKKLKAEGMDKYAVDQESSKQVLDSVYARLSEYGIKTAEPLTLFRQDYTWNPKTSHVDITTEKKVSFSSPGAGPVQAAGHQEDVVRTHSPRIAALEERLKQHGIS